MKKIISFLGLAVILAFSFTSFIGCQGEVATTTTSTTTTTIVPIDSLVGYWKSSWGDGFEITNATPKIYSQYDDATKTVSFAGEILNNFSFNKSGDNGFLTIKITNAGSWTKTVNQYFIISWKNLAVNICKGSTPFKTGGKSTCATQSEAETEFTEANGYYGMYGEYTKQ